MKHRVHVFSLRGPSRLRDRCGLSPLRSSVCAAATLFVLCAAVPAHAQTSSGWTTTSGLWNDAGNWGGTLPTVGPATSLTFNFVSPGAAVTLTNDLADPFILNSMAITSNTNTGVTFRGGVLQFAGPNAILMNNSTGTTPIVVANDIIIGGSGMTIQSTTAAANPARASSLNITGDISTTNAGLTILTLNGTSTSATNRLSGVVSDGTGGGTLAITKTGTGIWTLTNAANTFSGGISVQQGTLRYGFEGALGSPSGTIVLGTALNDSATLSYVNNVAASVNRTIAILGSSNVNISADSTGELTFDGVITYSGVGSKVLNLAATTTTVGHQFNAQLTNNGASPVGLSKSGNGIWELTNTGNSFTGGITILGGALRAVNPTTQLNLDNNNLRFSTTANTLGVLETSGTFTRSLGAGNGQIQFGGTGVAARNSGGFSAFGGDLDVILNNNATTPILWDGAASPTGISGTSELQFNSAMATGVVNFHNYLTLGTGSHRINVGQNPTSTTDFAIMSGNIAGIGGITKTGVGRLVLTGNNSFTGGVTIFAGMLQVSDTVANLNLPNQRLQFNGSNNGTAGVLQTSGALNFLGSGTGVGQVSWANNTSGGFAAFGGALSVTVTTDTVTPLVVGAAGLLTGTGELVLSSTSADNVVTWQNSLNLNATTLSIRVYDNTTTKNDWAVIAGALSNGSITKTGAGLLVLSGNNTFSGGLTIGGGVVRGANIATNLNLADHVTGNSIRFHALSGGSAVLETAGSLTNDVGLGANLIGWNVISSTGGSGGFSAFGGPLNITLNNDAATPLVWNSTAGFLRNSAELQFGSIYSDNVVTWNNAIDFNGATRVIEIIDNPDSTADFTVMTGVLSNGNLTKQGAGKLVLTADNTYTGLTTVAAGTLQLGNGGTTGIVAGGIRLNSANSQVVFNHSNIVTYGGAVAGAGDLVITGNSAGGLRLTATQTLTGTVNVDQGTLLAGLTTGTATFIRTLAVNTGATFNLGGSSVGIITLSDGTVGGGRITNTGGSAILTLTQGDFSGIIQDGPGTIGITKTGSAAQTLTLGGANTFSGPVTIFGGTLHLNHASALGNGSTLAFLNGALETNTNVLLNQEVILRGTGTFGGSGMVTVSGALTNSGGNRWLISNLEGGLFINGVTNLEETPFTSTVGRILSIGGSGPITFNGIIRTQGSAVGGTINITNTSAQGVTFAADNTFNGRVTIGAGSRLNVGAGGTTGNVTNTVINRGVIAFNHSNIFAYSGLIAGSGDLLIDGPATGGLRLNSVQTFTGVTTVNQGTLQYGVDDALSNVSGLTINSTGTFDLNGFTATVGNLGGAGIVTNNTTVPDQTSYLIFTGGSFAGTIKDGAVSKVGIQVIGNGTFQLGGSNTFSGDSTLFGGTVLVSGSNSLSSAAWFMDGGGIGAIGGTVTVTNPLNIMAGGMSVGGAEHIIFSGPLINNGGNRTLTIANAGLTQINELRLSETDNGRTLRLVVGGPTTVAAIVNGGTGAGSLDVNLQTGASLTVVQSSSYTGLTTVSGPGTLNIATGVTFGQNHFTIDAGAAVRVLSGGTLSAGTGTLSINGGSLFVANGGTVNSTVNTFVRNGGVLRLDGGLAGSITVDGGLLTGDGNPSGFITLTNGGILSPGGTGPATFSPAALVMNNGILDFQLGAPNVSSASDRLTVIATPSISNSILNITALDGFGVGTYTLISGFSTTMGGVPFPTVNAAVTGYSFTINPNISGVLQLNVGLAAGKTLNWTGSTNGNWDTSTTNWTTTLGAATYSELNHDFVVFSDVSANKVITLSTAVTPSNVIFNIANSTYTIQGSAGIAGATNLFVNGTGTLVLTQTNFYNGVTNINQGTLKISNTGTILAGSKILNNGTLIIDKTSNLAFGNSISGTGRVIKEGTGILTWNSQGVFNGGLTVNSGTLTVGSTGLLPVSGGWTINTGGNLTLGNSSQSSQTVNLAGGFLAGPTGISATLTIENLHLTGGTMSLVGGGITVTNLDFQAGTININNGVFFTPSLQMGGTVGTSAVINIAAARTLTLNSNVVFNAANDPNGAFISGPGILEFGNAARTFNIGDSVNAERDLTITAQLSDTTRIVKSGLGTLYLAGTNLSTSFNTLTAGAIMLGSDTALGTGTLRVTGTTATLMSDALGRTISNNIQQFGHLTIGGNQTLTIAGIVTNSNSRTLFINNTATTILAGTYQLSETNQARTPTIAGNGRLDVVGTLTNGFGSGADGLIINMAGGGTTGTIFLPTANTYTGLTSIRNGTVLISDVNSLGTSASAIFVGASGAAADVNILLNNNMTFTRGFDVVDALPGSVIRFGATAVSGTTIYSGGIAFASDIELSALTGGTTKFSGPLTSTDPAAGITIRGGGLVVLNGALSYNGPTRLEEGSLTFEGVNLPAATALSVNAGTLVNMLGTNQTVAALNDGSAGGGTITNSQLTASLLTIGGGTFSGSIQNGAGLIAVTKNTTGTLTLNGTNTYSGATAVTGGALIVNGSLGATSVSLAAGTRLGGTGSIAGSVTTAAGSVLAPGTSFGTLTTGTLTLNGGTLEFELSGTGNSDRIIALNTPLVTATTALSFTTFPGFDVGTYSLISGYAGTIANGHLLSAPSAIGLYGLSLQNTAGGVNLVVVSNAIDLTWVGSEVSNEWDFDTANWTGGSSLFTNDNTFVRFNDSAERADVAIDAAGVRPGAMFVTNNSLNYVFTGGDITSSGALTKSGTAEVVFANNANFAFGAQVAGGTLGIGDGGATGSFIGDINNLGKVAFNRTGTLAFNNVISGSGEVSFAGGGTFIVSGNQTYTGATSVAAGTTLQLGAGGATGGVSNSLITNDGLIVFDRSGAVTRTLAISGSGDVQIGASAVANMTYLADNTYTGMTTISAGSSLDVGIGGATGAIVGDVFNRGALHFNRSSALFYNGAISGTGTVSFAGGPYLLTADQSYTGVTSIAAGTSLVMGNGGAGGALVGSVTNDGLLAFNRTGSMTYGGVISGAGSVSFNGGAFTLTNNQTYTGRTTIFAGAMLLIGNGSTSGSLASDVTNFGVLAFNRSNNLNIGRVISGTGAVSFAGGGMFTLTNDQTYTGVTTIAAGGILRIGNGATAGSLEGTSAIANDGLLIFNRATAQTVTALISGGGALQVGDTVSSVVTLIGNNTYTGATTIRPGSTLNVGNGGVSGSIIGNVTNSGFLNFNRLGTTTIQSVIAGNGTVGFAGGSFILAGNQIYTGPTTIASSATLQLGQAGTGGQLIGNVANDGVLSFSGSSLTYTGVISGNGKVALRSGAIVFTGDHSYTGITTIDPAASLTLGTGGANGSVFGDIRNNNLLTFNRSGLVGYGSVISGTGAVQISAGTVTFTSDQTYTGATTILAGTILRLGAGGTNGALGNSVVVNDGQLVINRTGGTLTRTLGISGIGSLLIGNGTAVTTNVALLADNTYSGGTTITANSILSLGNGGTAGNVAGDITNSGALIFNRSNTVSFTGLITGNGSVTVTGGGTVIYASSTANNYTGGTTIGPNTTLQVGAAGVGGGISGNIVNSGNLTFSGAPSLFAYGNIITGAGGVTVNSGTVALTGANTYTGGTTVNGGTLKIGNGGGSGSITGSVANNSLVQLDRTGTFSFGSLVTGTGALHVARGNVTFSINQQYTGMTTISNLATLNLGNGSGPDGSVAGAITVSGLSSNVNFNRTGTYGYAGAISGLGNVTISNGIAQFTGASIYTGTTTVAAAAQLHLLDGGSLNSGAYNVAGGLTVSNSIAAAYNNILTGAGTFVKDGPGTFTFGGTGNTFTGQATVSGGALYVNGSLGSSIVNVASGATLGGQGTLASAQVTNNGTLSPGASAGAIGALTLNQLVLNGGSLLNFDLGALSGNNYDRILLSTGSTLTVNGLSTINLAGFSGLGVGTYNLISGYTGIISTTQFNFFTLNGVTTLSGFNVALDNGNGSINLVVTAPPANNITWSGGINTNWDAGTANWTGDAVTFTNGFSNVTFNNTTATNTIIVDAGGVQPVNMIVDNDGFHNYTFGGGAIVGLGNFTKTGDGTAVFTNDVSFSGGATVNFGVLQIGNGGATGSFNADITNNAVVAFNRSGSLTYTNVISGTGAVSFAGGGTFTVVNNQTYTGITTIDNAVLNVGNGSAGGSLAGNVANNGVLNFNRLGGLTYNGLISGSGAVSFTGGTYTLASNQTYTGMTTLFGGVLNLGTGGATGGLPGNITNSGLINFNRTGTLNYDGAISGTGGVTFTGGTFVFSNNQTYSGGTTISSGTLQIGNGGASGALTGDVLNNGILAFNRTGTMPNYTGVISGTGAVSVTGGTFVFTNSQTYTGATTIASGTLQVAGLASPTVDNSGVLAFGAGTTYGGVISGAGQVAVNAGIVTFTGANSYTGTTSIAVGAQLNIGDGGTAGQIVGNVANSGVLAFNRTGAPTYNGVINGTGAVSISAGTFTFAADQAYTGVTTINTGARLNVGTGGAAGNLAGNVSNSGILAFNRSTGVLYTGAISGTGAVSVTSGGTIAFTGANSYTGVTTILGGTLQIGNGGAGGGLVGDVVNNGALTFNGASLVYGGAISGPGGVTVNSNTLTITGNNTYGGGTGIVALATLQIGNGGTSGSITGDVSNGGAGKLIFNRIDTLTFGGVISGAGSVSVSTGTVVFSNNQTYGGSTTIAAGAAVQLNAASGTMASSVFNSGLLTFSGGNITYGNVISGTGAVNINSGNVVYADNNTYSGVTAIAPGALLTVGSGTSLGRITGNVTNNGALAFNRTGTHNYDGVISGTGTVSLTGGTFNFSNSQTYTGATTILSGVVRVAGLASPTVANSGVLTFSGAGSTYAGVISGGGAVSVTGGTFVFSNNQTYTGATTISAGTLQLGAAGAGGGLASPTVDNGGVLTFSGGNATYAGVISGLGQTAINSGIVTFLGANNYTGTTSIAAGAQLSVGNGGATGQIAGNVSNAGTLVFNRSGMPAYNGVISGAGNVSLSGGTFTFAADQTYNGVTTINPGAQLNVGAGGATGNLAGSVANAGILAFNRSTGATYAGSISGTGSVSVTSGGTVIFTGANNYTGVTTILGGTLQIGNAGAGGGLVGDVVNNAALAFNGAALGYGGLISGAGGVTVNTNTVTLTANNTYAGGTTIASGATLQIGNGGATGSIAGNVANAGILRFARSDALSFTGAITGAGSVAVQSGTLVLNSTQNYTGLTSVGAGAALRFDNSGAVTGSIANDGTVVLNITAGTATPGLSFFSTVVNGAGGLAVSTGTVNYSGAGTYSGATTIASGASLRLNDGAGMATSGYSVGGGLSLNFTTSRAFAGALSGNGSFFKSGSSTFVYSGNGSAFSGSTSVATGTLVVNGTLGGGPVSVAAGATLSGTGTIGGTVTSTGIIAPGMSSVGTLTLGGLVLNGGTLAFELGGTGDHIFLSGGAAPVVTATTDLSLTALGGFGLGTYSLINGYGLNTILNFGGINFSLTTLNGLNVNLQNNQGSLDLVVSAATSNTVTWVGNTSNVWNDTTSNWTGDFTTTFTNGVSSAIFNNTTPTNTIVVDAGGVQPQHMLVDNITGSTNAYTFSGGAINALGGLTKQGGGTLVFTNDAAFASGVTLAGGTLQIGNGGATGSLSGNVLNSGILAFNRSGTLNYANNISGSGAVSVLGGLTLALTGNNTYTGVTTVAAGSTLQIGNGGTSGSLVSDVVNGGLFAYNRTDASTYAGAISGNGGLSVLTGTLILTGGSNFSGATSVAAGAALQLGNAGPSGSITGNITNSGVVAFSRNDSTTYAGVINGAGALSIGGGGTVILTGNHTYTGATTVAGGSTLQIGNGGASGSITSNVANAGGVAFNRSAGNLVYGNVISGNGAVSVAGGMTLVLTGDNTYAGVTTVNSGSTLQLGNGGANGSIVGNVANSGSVVFNRSGAYGYGGAISGTGGVAINAGTATFTGANSYSGVTTIAGGAGLVLSGVNGAIAGNVSNLGTLTFANTQTYGGAISGNGVVVVNSGGTVTLAGNNTYDGATTVTAGTLAVTGALGSTPLTIDTAGTVIVGAVGGGTTGSIGSANVVNNGGLIFNRSDATSFAGAVSGTGTVWLKNGPVTFLSNNNYTGVTTVMPAGVLQLGNGGTTGAITGNVVNQGGTLVVNRSNPYAYNGNMSGTGGFTQAGSGQTTLGGANTYSGATSVAGGTLTIAGSLGNSVVSVGSGATLNGDGTLGGAVNVLTGGNLGGGLGIGGIVSSSGSLTPGGVGNVGTLSMASLVLGGGTLNFDLGTTAASDKLLITGSGIVSVNAATVLNYFNVGTLTAGTYNLIGGYTGTIGGFGLLNSASSLGAFSLTLHNNSGSLDLEVVITGNSIGWTGGNAVWDHSTPNFTGTSGAVSFTTGDHVTFGSNGNSIVTVTNIGVQPGSVIVNNDTTSTYTFNGGSIGGPGGLLKNGTGTLTLNNANNYTGGTTLVAGALNIGSSGAISNTGGVRVNGGTLTVLSGGAIVGGGQSFVSGGGTLAANGAVHGLVTVNAGGTFHGSGNVGAVVVNSGGTISAGNSVGNLTVDGVGVGTGPSLTLNAGADVVFEFRDADGAAGTGWDHIDLGTGVLNINANNYSAANQITLHVSSWKNDNTGPGGGTGPDFNNFDPSAGTPGGSKPAYFWKFVSVDAHSKIQVTDGLPGSVGGRFLVIDDGLDGVFGSGNPFTRPVSSLGEGTFRVLTGQDLGFGDSQAGLYLVYSAIPEPGSMILAGLASLGAGWYGRRRLRKSKGAAAASNSADAPAIDETPAGETPTV